MIEFVIQKLIALLPTLSELSRENREIRKRALSSISNALNETYLYYSNLERVGSRDFDKEAALSKLWANSAVHISFFDTELAQICEQKSDYWIKPENWSSEKIASTGIELNSVREKYRELLG